MSSSNSCFTIFLGDLEIWRCWWLEAAVDNFVAALCSTTQLGSTAYITCPYLFETEAIENRLFDKFAGIRLGRRGSCVRITPPRPIESIGYSLLLRGQFSDCSQNCR